MHQIYSAISAARARQSVAQRDFESLLQSIRQAALPISSLGESSVRELVRSANLIWGYDPKQDRMPLFYGRELLEDIAKGRASEFAHQMLLCFTIDLTTDEPELLRAAVESLKGSSCYRGKMPQDGE